MIFLDLEICDRKTYVISDIHNDAAGFKKMLKIAGFSKEDLLIIDGDIFDRGDNPVDLYFEILKHDNICCIRGNHDEWVRREIYDRIVGKCMGGYISYNTFGLLAERLTQVDMLNLADWIGGMPYYLKLLLDGQRYQISHAQTYPVPEQIFKMEKFYMGDRHHGNFLTGKYELKDAISVVGHTPTEDMGIWHSRSGKLIRVDCGNGFRNCGWGRLGMIRLNDGKEYYV